MVILLMQHNLYYLFRYLKHYFVLFFHFPVYHLI